MRSRDDAHAAHAASVRMRSAAPVAALVMPGLLVLLAVPAGLVWSDGAAAALLALAAPTAAVANVLMDDPTMPVLLASMTVSGPLWGLVGRAIADRVPNGEWRLFWRKYAVACVAWIAVAAILLLLVG